MPVSVPSITGAMNPCWPRDRCPAHDAGAAQRAQTVFSEDFTGTTTINSWYFFNGACLTASAASPGANPGQTLPGCTNTSFKSAYYPGENQVGGTAGVAGTAETLPDLPTIVNGVSTNTGALRFTNANGSTNNANGHKYGGNEGGAIVSAVPFPAANGVQITFKSVTYRGDSGGTSGDGADGMSFFLINGNGSTAPSIGSQGGSLAYTCSNPNNLNGHSVIDGVTGGYLGLGIDEYGNFLNGIGDSTNTGWGPQGGRIGLRGAGNVSWRYLNTNFPQYYPSSLTTGVGGQQQQAVAATCKSGFLWDYSNPSSPVAALTTGTLVTGTLAGKIAKNSTQITLIPSIPASLIMGATITDKNGYLDASTTYTVAAIGSNSITIAPAANGNPSKNGSSDNFNFSSGIPGQNVGILDYQAIPSGFSVLTGVQIANESALSRGTATPIFYNLKITPAGVLSLSYSFSGSAYQAVITNQDITQYNGTMPATFQFGFAGSTGGSTNIHEILCFQAAPSNTSGSSATVNEKESAKVETTTQAFFAFYNPGDWTGTVTANTLIDTGGVVTVNSASNWDAGCLLTGNINCVNTVATVSSTPVPTPSARVMLTWDTSNNVGIPFEFNTGINSNQQANLDAPGTTLTPSILSYLRGSRTNEINTSGVGLYRFRDSVLGDIVDSSPTWVGPPISPYTATWTDLLHSTGDSMVENSGNQNYGGYVSAQQGRLNVVYVGGNDGFLHGFEAGSVDSQGNLINNSTTPNDGKEIIAYMPGSTLYSLANSTTSANCTVHTATQTLVQNINGVTPIIGASPLCVDPTLALANPKYGHNFFVDATPGTGDLFYPDTANPNGEWHTWLVGGLGAGGAAIYALDITNPGPSPGNFSEGNASSVVLGEWTPDRINAIGCASTPAACGGNLGNTFGTPQIRRLHNGQWGVIFGNGFGSSTGDAGIYVMTISFSGVKLTPTFYYLSTGQAGGSNGIGYTTPVDLDGDHITDYVYAGDLNGNVWRFDLTSTNPAQWAVTTPPGGTTPAPLFTAPSGEPITTQLLAVSSTATGGPQRLLIEFGTGRRIQITNAGPATYASGSQALYGVWDWNFSAWNAMSGVQYASLGAVLPTTTAASVTATATGLSSPFTINRSSLTAQTFTIVNSGSGSSAYATGVVEGTNAVVCWQGSTACSSNNNKFGWYATLMNSGEQVIFNPVYFQGAILVDTTVPSPSNYTPTSCSSVPDAGFTYALNVTNGGIFNNAFPTFVTNPAPGNKTGTLANDPHAAAVETNATGSVYVVTTKEGKANVIFQTVTGSPGSQQINIPPNTKSKRLTWVEKR